MRTAAANPSMAAWCRWPASCLELVGTADGAAIYVEDHGKPVAPAGMTGKLTVLNGDQKSEAPISAGADKLEAKGVKLASGAKVVASLATADKKAITVRFTVK
jgi:hypothetical protein